MRRHLVVALLALSACGLPASATAPTAVEAGVADTPDDEMQATDPSTVVLAAGKPQLVEFFAFW